MCYEIPKREVDRNITKSQKKRLKELYDVYFKEHGLLYESVQAVRDSYVHRLLAIDDLIKNISIMSVNALMTFVIYHELDITGESLLLRKREVLRFLKESRKLYGSDSFNKIAVGRYGPGKEI